MFPLATLCVLLMAAPSLWAQTESNYGLKPEVLRLARLKVKAEENLLSQPNYTCLETIERSARRGRARRYRMIDTLRIEVGLVDGKEMYSWPGDREFKVTDLREIVPTGAIGTGSFSSHARSVFMSGFANHTYAGPEAIDGQATERYDYRITQNRSGYTIQLGDAEATVPYHGSYWVDAETLDLLRLDVHADEIPPHLNLETADSTMEYRRTEIGGGDFLLPSRAVTVLTQLNGDASRNEINFSECRQFSGESFLSFGDAPEEEPEPVPAPALEFSVPAGLELRLELETGIASGQSAVGDEVRAVTIRDAKRSGEVVVPAGAIVRGRLLHMERVESGGGVRTPGRSQYGEEYYVVALRFESIEFENRRGALGGQLVRFTSFVRSGAMPQLRQNLTQTWGGQSVVTVPHLEALPGAAVFYVKGGELDVPPGTRMIWRTAK